MWELFCFGFKGFCVCVVLLVSGLGGFGVFLVWVFFCNLR